MRNALETGFKTLKILDVLIQKGGNHFLSCGEGAVKSTTVSLGFCLFLHLTVVKNICFFVYQKTTVYRGEHYNVVSSRL